jgi:hypothetical protein
MPSGLLTSWAMPAASWPMLASFSDLTSASLVLSSERCDSSRSSTWSQLLDHERQAHLGFGEPCVDGHRVVAGRCRSRRRRS